MNFRYVYVYCNNAKQTEKGYDFEIKPYKPSNINLQQIAREFKNSTENDNTFKAPWVDYIKKGLSMLGSTIEQDFNRPNIETDKLYMSIGERDLIEVAHPVHQDNTIKR